MIEYDFHPKVDEFITKSEKWSKGYKALRMMLIECGLTEDFKWRNPCYTINGKNVVLIHGFKDYFGLGFIKGVLLNDPEKMLHKQTEKMQEPRVMRFTTVEEVYEIEDIIKAYVKNAIEVEQSGLKYDKAKTEAEPILEELTAKFEADPEFEEAFKNLTPGRQRAYLIHFNQAKQSATKTARIEKYTEKIFAGKGMLDR